MKDLTIYTDGSISQPNDGTSVGGWAFVVLDYDGPGSNYEYGSYGLMTTNNRMELAAAINALEMGDRGAFITIVTDSQYVQRCFARRQWPESKPNSDLGRALMNAKRGRFIEVKLVPGHSGDKWNDRAHELANEHRLEGVEYAKRRQEELATRKKNRIEDIVQSTLPERDPRISYTNFRHVTRLNDYAPTSVPETVSAPAAPITRTNPVLRTGQWRGSTPVPGQGE